MKSIRNYLIFLILTGWLTACSPHKKITTATGKTASESPDVSNTAIQSKYSALLNVDKDAIQQLNLYRLIDEWYGTAYKYGGCDKNGIDCSNFVGVVYQEIYKKKIQGSSASVYNQCNPVVKDQLREGDLVFFKIDHQTISHVGVYLQNNKFIHATTQKGVMINDLNEPYYSSYFYKGGRLK